MQTLSFQGDSVEMFESLEQNISLIVIDLRCSHGHRKVTRMGMSLV